MAMAMAMAVARVAFPRLIESTPPGLADLSDSLAVVRAVGSWRTAAVQDVASHSNPEIFRGVTGSLHPIHFSAPRTMSVADTECAQLSQREPRNHFERFTRSESEILETVQ